MSLQKRRLLHKRQGYLPPSGSVIESIPTPTASTLVQNTAAPTGPAPSGIPLVDSSVLSTLPTSTLQSSTPTSGASSATSGEQISLGAVIGACAAALAALLLSVLLAFHCSKRYKQSPAHAKSRNAINNASRRRSHLEAWKRMDDGGHRKGQDQSMEQLSSHGPLGAMFHRSTSNESGEKSSIHRESVGTMRHFAKYHPGLAAEMASQGATTDADSHVTKPKPVLRLPGRTTGSAPPISWDGETVGGGSFFSNAVSPAMIVTERLTPPATASDMHRWESAKVLHTKGIGSGAAQVGEHENPFSDTAASVKSSVKSASKGRNPFFGAQDHPIRRASHSGAQENPFADTNTPRDSSEAIRSLIAALEVPQELDGDRIVSVQSSFYSRTTGDDSDSAISVTAFPYPPGQVTIH